MDKIISDEERIRKAEEISARRQSKISINSINSSNNKKRKISYFNKLFIQIIVSICIFGIMYFISQKNSYAIEKIKPVMSNDTNFEEIYNQINNAVQYFTNNNKFNNTENNENKNNEETKNEINNELEKDKDINNSINNRITDGIGGGNEGTKESQNTDDITYIKNSITFVKPVIGVITSPYGKREPTDIISENHQGVDIGAVIGTDIVSAMDGTVEYISDYGDYGMHLKITNGEISTLYAHCSKIVVNTGDIIKQGQKIAEVGETGKATGPHLHFEIRRNDITVDPQKIMEL